ncbi:MULTISPECIES: carbohydrate-binding family 9-like protein [Hymenobacter]|uniref:carbohydrate-binding family 9-like protein n=1 Tax=Hymenobacter TaxID=89966 RepID=UPI001F208ECA|nr:MULTISPECIES: carbohydrate-binding family 9-like protein [unclassified Hymenobacter]
MKPLLPICAGLGLAALGSLPGHAQTPFQGLENLFTPPLGYVVQHTSQPLAMDGSLQESDWQKAPWTTDFVDIEGATKPRPTFQTRVKMLWNDSTLFIAATLQEPQLWAYQTHHDDIIYKDNDFEVFIDPDNNAHQYFEVEVNALNKIFDLYLPKPYRDKGDALISWDVAGLRSGVALAGTLNQPHDQDQGWTVEMAIPLKAVRMGFPWQPPTEGTLWRINFSRVEWDTKVAGTQNVKLQDAAGKDLSEHNWVWSPQGVINMHCPERWGYLQFTRRAGTTWQLPVAELRKQYLWLVYYRQQQYKQRTGHYAASLAELRVAPQMQVAKQANQLALAATPYQFTAILTAAGQPTIRLNDEGLVETLKP